MDRSDASGLTQDGGMARRVGVRGGLVSWAVGGWVRAVVDEAMRDPGSICGEYFGWGIEWCGLAPPWGVPGVSVCRSAPRDQVKES